MSSRDMATLRELIERQAEVRVGMYESIVRGGREPGFDGSIEAGRASARKAKSYDFRCVDHMEDIMRERGIAERARHASVDAGVLYRAATLHLDAPEQEVTHTPHMPDIPPVSRPAGSNPDGVHPDTPQQMRRVGQHYWDCHFAGAGGVKPAFNRESGALLYLDRVDQTMFMGRYDYGSCPKKTLWGNEHLYPNKPGLELDGLGRHAYVVVITRDMAHSRCVHCGATMDHAKAPAKTGTWHITSPLFGFLVRLAEKGFDKLPWDEPWSGPRRATKTELEALHAKVVDGRIHGPGTPHMLYLDAEEPETDQITITGRCDWGECQNGGPHAVIVYWRYKDEVPVFSTCVFCGESWSPTPAGFGVDPSKTVQSDLEHYADFKARGVW